MTLVTYQFEWNSLIHKAVSNLTHGLTSLLPTGAYFLLSLNIFWFNKSKFTINIFTTPALRIELAMARETSRSNLPAVVEIGPNTRDIQTWRRVFKYKMATFQPNSWDIKHVV